MRAKALRMLTCLIALTMQFFCGQGRPGRGLSMGSRSIMLTSDYTEVAVDSSKVPGYWGNQVAGGQEFFIYTLDRSYKKGDVLRVEGAFGATAAAVFNDETLVYQDGQIINIIVVWKVAVSAPPKDRQPRP